MSVPLTVSDPAPAEHPNSSVNVPVTVNDPTLKDPWQVRSCNVSEGASRTVKEPTEVSVANGLLPEVSCREPPLVIDGRCCRSLPAPP